MEGKQHKSFDQIFQEKLQNHEVVPPAHIWEGIQAGSSASASNSWRWWAVAGIMAFILGTASYLYFSNDSESNYEIESLSKQNIEIPQNLETDSELPLESSSDKMILSEEEEQEVIQSIEESFNVEEQMSSSVEPKNDMQLATREEVTEVQQTDDSENNIQIVSEETNQQPEIQKTEISRADALFKEIHEEKPSSELTETETKTASKAGYDFFDDDVIDDITKGHNEYKRWELGLEFSPEWITIPENDNNIKSYGLDLSARYHFSKWFIESGIGAALSRDDGIYGVDYVEAIFKGSYEDVYNVTFDTSGINPTPIYHTKTVNVYDSIDKYVVTENKNTYAYINIPLNIGYNMALGKKFAFYAKTGLIASFRIYENIPTPVVDGTITRYIPLYYERTPWHLQAQVNVGINYYITEKFMFGVEPNVRYYLKSLVEDNAGGNPYGFGVKIGFKYVIKK